MLQITDQTPGLLVETSVTHFIDLLIYSIGTELTLELMRYERRALLSIA